MLIRLMSIRRWMSSSFVRGVDGQTAALACACLVGAAWEGSEPSETNTRRIEATIFITASGRDRVALVLDLLAGAYTLGLGAGSSEKRRACARAPGLPFDLSVRARLSAPPSGSRISAR